MWFSVAHTIHHRPTLIILQAFNDNFRRCHMTLTATQQLTNFNPINMAHQCQCHTKSFLYVASYITHVSKTSWHIQVIKILWLQAWYICDLVKDWRFKYFLCYICDSNNKVTTNTTCNVCAVRLHSWIDYLLTHATYFGSNPYQNNLLLCSFTHVAIIVVHRYCGVLYI